MAKILIADDALFMRKLLGDILKKAGHEIIGEAHNANEAIDLYKKLKPDLVTLDLIMPEVQDINSVQAIKIITSWDHDAKIIIVSAMGQQQNITESLAAGAKEFITKPFEEANVMNAVQKLIAT